MATLCWWYYISKLTEFADTVFFVIRKKDSQVSLLHLYHHSLTPIETWILVKFLAGKRLIVKHKLGILDVLQKKSNFTSDLYGSVFTM